MKLIIQTKAPLNGYVSKKGFTLIELLVVIAIIGLLSSVILGSLNTARQRSRDISRLDTLREIRTALENYRNDAGRYPDASSALPYAFSCFDCTSYSGSYGYINTDTVNTASGNSIGVVLKKYLASTPKDPYPQAGATDGGYLYSSTANGGDYCIMSFKFPENMNNFNINTVDTNRCGLPILPNGGCTSGVNAIYFSSNPSAWLNSNGTSIGC